jgi:PAS domain S-box-containing protein
LVLRRYVDHLFRLVYVTSLRLRIPINMVSLRRIFRSQTIEPTNQQTNIRSVLNWTLIWTMIASVVAWSTLLLAYGLDGGMIAFAIGVPILIGMAWGAQRLISPEAACYLLSFGWIALTVVTQLMTGSYGAGVTGAMMGILAVGMLLNRTAARNATIFFVVVLYGAHAYYFGAQMGFEFIKSLIAHTLVAVSTYIFTAALVTGKIVVQRQLDSAELSLSASNTALRGEIAERHVSERKQAQTMQSLESVLAAGPVLMAEPTMSAFWRKAVETARDQLGFERVAIFLYDEKSDMFNGTSGTTLSGQVVDESSNRWAPNVFALAQMSLQAADQRVTWLLDEDCAVESFENGRLITTERRGWSICTPLRVQSGKTLGVILNDAAISGTAHDPVRQDVLCVYASTLANLALRKQLGIDLETANVELEQRVLDRTQLLTESEQRFRALVQQSGDAFAVLNADLSFAFVNPSAAKSLGVSPDALTSGHFDPELHPEDWPALRRLLACVTEQAVLSDCPPQGPFRLRHSSGAWVTFEINSATKMAGSDQYLISASDITERLRAESAVEQQIAVERLTSSISTQFLTAIDDHFADAIDFALRAIGEHMSVDFCRVFMHTEDGRHLSNAFEWHRAGVASQQHLLQNMPLVDKWDEWVEHMVRKGRVQIDDMRLSADTLLLPVDHQELIGRDIGALLDVPILIDGVAVGSLAVDMLLAPRKWTASELSMMQLCAGLTSSLLGRVRAAQALRAERDQLDLRVKERTATLNKVLDTANGLTAHTERNALLELILRRLHEIVAFDGANISTVGEDGDLHVVARINDGGLSVAPVWGYDADSDVDLKQVFEHLTPVPVQDVFADNPIAAAYRSRQVRQNGGVPKGVRSVLYVPLVFQGRLLGMLAMTSAERNYYTPQRSSIAVAFSNFAASALENVHAHASAVKGAALEERSRLARELHDSVSQALFGIVLGTRTAIHRIDEAPVEAADPMKYVLALAEAALAEMRALIFELRPESLEQQGLVTAFRKQAEALCARHKIDVRIDFDTREPNMPIEIKEALYRVALEAIQNTIKHAHASRVDLTLKQIADTIHLEVQDNGLGFDTSLEYIGHFGLHTMRERIVKFGGEVGIDSKLGEGTRVRVWVPAHPTSLKRADEVLVLETV